MSPRAALLLVLRRLGWPGMLALAASLLAVGLALSLNEQESALAGRHEELARQRTALQQRSRTEATAAAASSLPAFVASFPDDESRQARTEALLSLAAEKGLPLPRSDFRFGADPALGLAQYRVSMSLSGNYAQIRSYVAEALRRDPALSLDSLRLRRVQAGAAELAGELSWVLHMRAAGAEPRT